MRGLKVKSPIFKDASTNNKNKYLTNRLRSSVEKEFVKNFLKTLGILPYFNIIVEKKNKELGEFSFFSHVSSDSPVSKDIFNYWLAIFDVLDSYQWKRKSRAKRSKKPASYAIAAAFATESNSQSSASSQATASSSSSSSNVYPSPMDTTYLHSANPFPLFTRSTSSSKEQESERVHTEYPPLTYPTK